MRLWTQAFKELAQNGHGVRRSARRSCESLSCLAARIRALYAIATFGLAAVIPAIVLAGPPGGPGYAAGGPISGPAPLGASGPAPLNATGSLIGAPQRGGAFTGVAGRGRIGGGNRNPGGVHNGGRRGDSRRFPATFFFAPYSDSFGDYGSPPYDSSYYGPDPGPDPGVQNLVQSQGQLSDQVRRLSAEIEQLRENQGPNSPYEMQTSDGAQNQQPAAVPFTLVLHSGQKLQIQNYAVMDGVFWDFSRQPVRKIPLSDIDVAASVKLSKDAGSEFPDLSTDNQAGN